MLGPLHSPPSTTGPLYCPHDSLQISPSSISGSLQSPSNSSTGPLDGPPGSLQSPPSSFSGLPNLPSSSSVSFLS